MDLCMKEREVSAYLSEAPSRNKKFAVQVNLIASGNLIDLSLELVIV